MTKLQTEVVQSIAPAHKYDCWVAECDASEFSDGCHAYSIVMYWNEK